MVRRIQMLGLRVAVHKTEALWFHKKGRRPSPEFKIRVDGSEIRMSSTIKYLGLTLDGNWTFVAHFTNMVPRLRREMAVFGRLLPNVGGPGDGCRRLYATMMASIALYEAPVWHRELRANRKSMTAMLAVQRVLALRIARGYRTVALEAALILAGQLPWDRQAGIRALMYEWRISIRAQRIRPTLLEMKAVDDQLRLLAIKEWQDSLSHCDKGVRVVEAIRPSPEEWMDRRHGGLTYRLT